MSKLTRWFSPKEKPVHIGVYQTDAKVYPGYVIGRKDHIGYQHWNGKHWGLFSNSKEDAVRQAHVKSNFQKNYFRGLAKKSK